MPRRNTTADQARYTALKRRVLELGFIRRGTITEVRTSCGKSGCRCMAKPPELHGPYQQWTFKVEGKTKTVRLSPEEVTLVERWIANGRQLDALVEKMLRVSVRATNRLLEGGPK